MTKTELKTLVALGAAKDITNEPTSMETYRTLDPIGTSKGKNGINGGLLRNNKTGELCVILARNSALFFYF